MKLLTLSTSCHLARRHPGYIKSGEAVSRLVLSFLLLNLGLLHAQVGVSGITDKTVYADSASFVITNISGFAYNATLDGSPVGVGVPVIVKQVDYHELSVWRTNLADASVTNRLLRFIVSDSGRDGTEIGIPSWVPYPMIPSTPEEAAGAHIRLLAPAVYPVGMEVPVAVWIENEGGNPVRVNGTLTAAGQPSITIRRGVGSGFLWATNRSGPLLYRPCLLGLELTRTIQIETNTVWLPISGSLSGDVIWPENSHMSIEGDLTLKAGATLTVGAGTIIRIGSSNSLSVAGHIVLNGTADRPIILTPFNRSQPWGGFYLTNSTSLLDASFTIFTGSGANPNAVPDSHRHEQCLFYCDNHARLNLTNCAVLNLAGQLGHGVDRGQPWNSVSLVRTLIQRCTTGGEWNGSAVRLLQSALIETPYETASFYNGDEDGIYFTTGEYVVRDSLIGWTRDDGIDSGSGGAGSVTVSNTWIESTFHEAFAWSGGGRVTTNFHTVCLNCGQGIECGYSITANSPNDFVNDCLSTANLIGARFGDNYDWTYSGFLRVTNSLLLHNYRDVWGCNWKDWSYRSSAMDIQGNYLSAFNPIHPNNSLWDSHADGWRLAPFMTTPPNAPVGIGFAVRTTQFDFNRLTNAVPVRLSSFTTNFVSVDYILQAPDQVLARGTLAFAPGETVRPLSLGLQTPSTQSLIRLQLDNPVNGRITGQRTVWFLRPSSTTNTVLVPAGSVWRYLDTGTNAGSAWREPQYDDSAWPSGPAELGYGDDPGRPEATKIGFGNVETDKYITYYFRHHFIVTNPASWGALTVRLKRDDGGVVYLKGREVFRSNLPDGPVNYLTRATLAGDDGTVFYSTNASSSSLVPGTNCLAVEIHQESPGSSDISFDLELLASPRPLLNSVWFDRDWVLTWDDVDAALEQADSLSGPWSVVSNSSPAALDTSALSRFFRLRKTSD